MKLGSRQKVIGLVATAIVGLLNVPLNGPLSALPAKGQTAPAGQPPGAKPPMAEDVFKNVQVLRGIPVDEFMATMGFIAASLSLNCLDCHTEDSGRNPAKYAEDTPIKHTARKMLLMMK